jgi:hypothetical protein
MAESGGKTKTGEEAAGKAGAGTSWEAYRNSWRGGLMELARVPGELAAVFGIFSMSPVGLGVAALGALEVLFA